MTQPRWKRLGFPSQQSFAGKCSAVKRKIAKINPRRFELINKQVDKDLTQAETDELEQLQKEIGELVDIIAPLPFEHLEKMEKQLRDALQRQRDRQGDIK